MSENTNNIRRIRCNDFTLRTEADYRIALAVERSQLERARAKTSKPATRRHAPDVRTLRAIDGSLQQTLANTMGSLYRRAREGDPTVTAAKVAAAWTVAAETPKYWVTETPPKSTVGMRLRLFALLAWVVVALDRTRIDSGLHVEPTHSNVARWAKSQAKIVRRERLAADTAAYGDHAVCITDADAFHSDYGDFEAGQLIADCHGYKTIDESNTLGELERFAKSSHRMASESDLISDGCEPSRHSKGRSLKHNGMDFADAVRDEIGPWMHEFTTEEGELVRMGYQGSGASATCDKCDGALDIDGTCFDCGYNPTWDDEAAAYDDEANYAESQAKRYLADGRVERSNRFATEFEHAANCSDIVEHYRLAWVRYRDAQIRIGNALEHAPKGHGLWGLTHITKEQFAAIEFVYAKRSGLDTMYSFTSRYPNKKGEYETITRMEICKERPNTEECIAMAADARGVLNLAERSGRKTTYTRWDRR